MARPKKQHLKRRPDGRFRCKYHGKEFYSTVSDDDALNKRDEYKRQIEHGEYIRETGITVREYADEWLPLHKTNVSTKCYNDYKKQLDALTDALGDMKMKNVTVDDASSVWKHYHGYSASTIKRARMLYVALFDSAAENDLCRKNPFRGRFAQPPKAPSGTHRALSPEEIRLIKTVPHRVQLAALIMLYCGLRRGEVLALTNSDIDLKENVIIVDKAVRFDGNQPVIVAPKTASGVRRVPILSNIRPLLKTAPQRILASANGKIMTDTAFRRAWDSYLHALSVAAGHPVNIRPHDLRHTYCTILCDAGVDMHQAMLWMGHSDEKMIIHVYDHVTEQRTKNSVLQVENLLKPAVKGSKRGSNTVLNPLKPLIQQRFTAPYSSDSDSEGHAFESHRAYHEEDAEDS